MKLKKVPAQFFTPKGKFKTDNFFTKVMLKSQDEAITETRKDIINSFDYFKANNRGVARAGILARRTQKKDFTVALVNNTPETRSKWGLRFNNRNFSFLALHEYGGEKIPYKGGHILIPANERTKGAKKVFKSTAAFKRFWKANKEGILRFKSRDGFTFCIRENSKLKTIAFAVPKVHIKSVMHFRKDAKRLYSRRLVESVRRNVGGLK